MTKHIGAIGSEAAMTRCFPFSLPLPLPLLLLPPPTPRSGAAAVAATPGPEPATVALVVASCPAWGQQHQQLCAQHSSSSSL